MADRLRISLKKSPAITINRVALTADKLVYIICADKMIGYKHGRTPIVYIGTTQKGVSRIASSATHRADAVLTMHGVKSFDIRIVACGARQGVRSWKKLERALLIVFREKFGEVPKCNVQGKNIIAENEFELFAKSRITDVIDGLTETGKAQTREISD